MTGKELIKWIIDNHAEELQVLIEHRDSGGSYHTAERLGELQKPVKCVFADELYGTIDTIISDCDNPTAILL